MVNLKKLMAQMTFEEKAGQLAQYNANVLRDPVASNARPIQQLVDFQKVEFAPYERKIVTFALREKQLRFWNNENQLVSEPGLFQISTGWADHLLHTKQFRLK